MKILYATDGSPSAFDAKGLLAKLFRREGMAMTVVSVTHSGSLDPGHLILQLDPVAGRRDDSRKIVDAAAKELQSVGFDTSTLVLEGNPGPELVKLAADGYDLVVVGAGSHSWLGNRLLGSVSTYVLHESPCSVLVMHEAPRAEGVARVVVGVDGSTSSADTVQRLGKFFDPELCEVEVLSVIPDQAQVLAPMLVGAAGTLSPEMASRMDAELVERSEGHLRAAVETLADEGFKTTSRLEHGSPAMVLLEAARRRDADLVVLGSRGLGPVRRAFIGSVSDQVARLAKATLVGRF